MVKSKVKAMVAQNHFDFVSVSYTSATGHRCDDGGGSFREALKDARAKRGDVAM